MLEHRTSRTLLAIVFVVVAVTITGLDLWTKKAVFEFLNVKNAGNPPHVIAQERYEILPGWFELEANYNYGAFSGWFAEHTGWLALLSGAALLIIVVIFVLQLRQPEGPGWLFTLSLGLLWGGTCGNFYDRFVLKAVRDWIKWYYVSANGKEHVWPNFNIADSAICTGVGMLVLLELLRATRQKKDVPSSVPALGSEPQARATQELGPQ